MSRVHHTLTMTGLPLDYALAMALDWTEPMYGIGKIRYVEQDNFMCMDEPDPDEPDEITLPHHFNHYLPWAPQRLKSVIHQLICRYKINISWIGDVVFVSLDGVTNTNENVGTAIAQLIVACKFGVYVELPDNII